MAENSTSGPGDRVASAARELYGRPLADFTAARADRARQARADGDRAAAAAIGRLAKPSVVAWLANQLARQHPGDLAPLLELGEALRQATAALDAAELRQLSGRQQQVIPALVGQARVLAAAAGQAVSDSTARGLEDTLHAALADESAAGELIRGQLTAGLSRTGFPGIDSAGGAAQPAPRTSIAPAVHERTPGSAGQAEANPARPGERARKAETERRAAAAAARQQQVERARRAEADAQDYASEAGRDQDRARSVLAAAQHAAQQAEAAITRLQDELDAALDGRNNAGRAQRQARQESDRADRTVRQAERRLAEAAARRQELERGA